MVVSQQWTSLKVTSNLSLLETLKDKYVFLIMETVVKIT
jgi:hypothetical protein